MHSTNSPSISVLIVNYRAYDELDDCLTSVTTQPGVAETIVVDHATDPDSRAVVERRHPGVRWLPTTANPGFAAGVNRAAQVASGEFLYLVNPDAIVANGTPWQLAGYLAAHPTVGVIGSGVWDPDGTLQGSARRFPGLSTVLGGRTTILTRWIPDNPITRRNVLSRPEMTEPVEVDWISGASMMIRKAAFASVGGMDDRFFLYWEDADLCKRLSDQGWKTVYHPGTSVMHLCGRSSQASPESIVAFHESAYRYYRLHGGRWSRYARPLAFTGLRLRMLLKLWAARRSRRAAR